MITAVLNESIRLNNQEIAERYFRDRNFVTIRSVQDYANLYDSLNDEFKSLSIIIDGNIGEFIISLVNEMVLSLEEDSGSDLFRTDGDWNVVVICSNHLFLDGTNSRDYSQIQIANYYGLCPVMRDDADKLNKWRQSFSLSQLYRMSQLYPHLLNYTQESVSDFV